MNKETTPITAEEQAKNVMRMVADVQERQSKLYRELEEGGNLLNERIKRDVESQVKPIQLLEELTEQNEYLQKQNEKLNTLTKWLIALTFILVILTILLICIALGIRITIPQLQ